MQTNISQPVTPFHLLDKKIIITGASSGIGRASAIAASTMGATLMLFGRNRKRLEETLALTANPERHSLFSLDLTDYNKIELLFDDFNTQKFKIHGLVNCAGISTTTPLNKTTPKKIQHYTATNVSAGIFLSGLVAKRCFVPDSGSSIIFISSVMGVAGEIGKTLYSITKGALVAATRSMALELARKKIRVNCISPGVVVSPMSKNAIYNRDEEALAAIKRNHPLGLGTPEDVANACIYLLSDASRWVTGTNLVIDGGYLAK